MQAAFAPVVSTRAVFGPAVPIGAVLIAVPMCAVAWAWVSAPPPSVRPSQLHTKLHTTTARHVAIRRFHAATNTTESKPARC